MTCKAAGYFLDIYLKMYLLILYQGLIIPPGSCITVRVNICGVSASAKVYKGAIGTPVLTYLSVTRSSAVYSQGWTGTFTLS